MNLARRTGLGLWYVGIDHDRTAGGGGPSSRRALVESTAEGPTASLQVEFPVNLSGVGRVVAFRKSVVPRGVGHE